MKAIFLASGTSSRMNPFKEKNFIEFFEKPLCLHLIENAMKGGVEEFVIISNGENKEKLEALIKKEKIKGKVVVQKDLKMGMAGGIADGLAEIDDEESVLVLGGNDYFPHAKMKEVVESLKSHDGAMLCHKVEKYFPGGYVVLGDGGTIKSIIEKPGKGNEPSDLVNIVCHGFKQSRDLKKALEKARSSKDDVYEVALDALFKEKKFIAIENGGDWQAVKYPWHIYDMAKKLRPNGGFISPSAKGFISSSARIHPTAIIEDDVIIEDGVRVFPYACIGAGSVIGRGSTVGNNALVRESFVGENCQIGYNSEVARSFLFNNVSTHMAYIGDSVVGENVNFGAYSCTANLRLDAANVKVRVKENRVDTQKNKCGAFVGKNAQIGSHVVIMPGKIIAEGELVVGK